MIMSKLSGAWFGGALIGLTFVVVPGCKGESVTDDDGDGTQCGKFAGKLKGCDMGDLVSELDCEEPDDDETRCTFECVFAASCEEIRTAVCSETGTSDLETCFIGCEPGPFTCGDGSTVPEYTTCDGYPDCLDGSDERANCPTCGNGETYPDYARCDDYPDVPTAPMKLGARRSPVRTARPCPSPSSATTIRTARTRPTNTHAAQDLPAGTASESPSTTNATAKPTAPTAPTNTRAAPE